MSAAIWADVQGIILDITEEAAQLLARTRRTLWGKSMLLFVSGNRDTGPRTVTHEETTVLKELVRKWRVRPKQMTRFDVIATMARLKCADELAAVLRVARSQPAT